MKNFECNSNKDPEYKIVLFPMLFMTIILCSIFGALAFDSYNSSKVGIEKERTKQTYINAGFHQCEDSSTWTKEPCPSK